MKAIWKGSISFGLVNIPIQLFSAIQEHVLGFKLLCAQCHGPIQYQRWCPHCKQQIAWNDVVKGLEVKKGSYVILTQEKIKELKPETTNTISILEFLDSTTIAPIYYDSHYYIAPADVKKAKAYMLFLQALKDLNTAAIGSFVMHEKEHVCVLQFYNDIILLSTLNYAYEIRDASSLAKINKAEAKTTPAEAKLAKELIRKLTVKKFDISNFKDSFAQKLLEVVKKAKKGKIVQASKKKKTVEKKSKASLESLLQESLVEARA